MKRDYRRIGFGLLFVVSVCMMVLTTHLSILERGGIASVPTPRATPRPNPRRPPMAQPSAEGRSKSVTNRIGMEMVYIPAGSFMMGSEKYDSEKPVHQVSVQSFYIGKYEVTQAQWRAVMGTNPSLFKNCDQCPVETVSWHDAQEFINKLNEMNDGYKYRLPTEAEWEYAARAGTTGDHAGDLDEMAWYVHNSGKKTHPVGRKQANGFGLYDMHGNVREWVRDYWHENYNGAPTDGSAWVSGGDSSQRVLRGGSSFLAAVGCRSAGRFRYQPYYRIGDLGFRVFASART